MLIKDMPISNVEWVDVDLLEANDYNPNVVFGNEFKLLKFSLLKQGWIQPVLVCRNNDKYTIIDGFHRSTLVKTDKEVREFTNGKIPVVVLDIDEAQRKCLTIRINRAKGSHVAVKMSDIIKSLINEHNMSIKDICKEIGATKDEVDLLMMDDVFKALDIENKEFSKAWYPR